MSFSKQSRINVTFFTSLASLGFLRLLGGVLAGMASVFFLCTGCNKAASKERPAPRPPKGQSPSQNLYSNGLPTKTLYLARHGETHMNRLGWINGQNKWDALNPLGFKQRVGLFALLKDRPVKTVFVSEMYRTHQTAAPLAAHYGVEPIIVEELNEFSGGIFRGICTGIMRKYPPTDPRSKCDIPSNDPLVKMGEKLLMKEFLTSRKAGLSYRAPGGGESVKDVEKRLKSFLARFPKRLADKEALIVGHGGTNRFLLALLMGWSLESARKVRQTHTQVFRLKRRKGNKIELSVFHDGKWTRCQKPPHPKKGLHCLQSKK